MEYLNKIKHNFKLAFEDYMVDHKSLHWDNSYKNFSKNINSISNFRNKKKLSIDLDDYGGFFQTIDALLKLIDICGKKFIDENTENLIGNPEQVYEIGDKKYNYNDLHNVNNLFQIKKNLKKNPKLILEIGGGYGCLMAKLKKNFNDTKIISIDLPEALLLQSYYLHSIFPEKNFFLYEDFKNIKNFENFDLQKYDFYLLPPWALKKFKYANKIDLIINIDSMMEMRKSIIAEYFDLIHYSLAEGGIFYNVNKYLKSASGDTVKISEYPYNKKWKVLCSENYWLKKNIHTLITEKTNYDSENLNLILSSLPKKNYEIKVDKGFKKVLKLALRKICDKIFLIIPKEIWVKLLKIYL